MHNRYSYQPNSEIDFLASYLAGALTEQDAMFRGLLITALRSPKTRHFIFDTQSTYPHIQAQGRLITYITEHPDVVDEILLKVIQNQQHFRALPAFQIQEQLLQVIYLIEQYQVQREARKQQTTFGFISMFSSSREAFFIEIAELKQLTLKINLNYEVNARVRLGQMHARLASLITAKEQKWLGRTNTGPFTFEEQININEKIGLYKQEIASVFRDAEWLFEDIQKLFAEFEAIDRFEENLIYDVAPISDILGYQPIISPEASKEALSSDAQNEMVAPSTLVIEAHPWQQANGLLLYPNLDEAVELALLSPEPEEAPPSYAVAISSRMTERDLITFSKSETASSAPAAPQSEMVSSAPAEIPVTTSSLLDTSIFPRAPAHKVVIKETPSEKPKLAAPSLS